MDSAARGMPGNAPYRNRYVGEATEMKFGAAVALASSLALASFAGNAAAGETMTWEFETESKMLNKAEVAAENMNMTSLHTYEIDYVKSALGGGPDLTGHCWSLALARGAAFQSHSGICVEKDADNDQLWSTYSWNAFSPAIIRYSHGTGKYRGFTGNGDADCVASPMAFKHGTCKGTVRLENPF